MSNEKNQTMEERLDALCDVDYDTLDGDETEHGCCIGMAYSGGRMVDSAGAEWTVWLTDFEGSDHTAVAVLMENGEYTENYLKVEPSCSPTYGEGQNEFSVSGSSLEEAVSKLEAMVKILKSTPNARLLFTWDD